MKTTFFLSRKMALVFIGLPLITASCRSSSTATAEDPSSPPVVIKTDDPSGAIAAEAIAPEPIPADSPAAAPVAEPAPAPVIAKLSPAADEVVKMAQSGVGEDVML